MVVTSPETLYSQLEDALDEYGLKWDDLEAVTIDENPYSDRSQDRATNKKVRVVSREEAREILRRIHLDRPLPEGGGDYNRKQDIGFIAYTKDRIFYEEYEEFNEEGGHLICSLPRNPTIEPIL